MRFVFIAVLLAFGTFNLYVLKELGYWAFFPPFEHLISTQLFTDLVISASIALWLIARDARERGRPLWPAALTGVGIALFGSQALLVYLILDRVLSSWPSRRSYLS